jgi:hypothetical protein
MSLEHVAGVSNNPDALAGAPALPALTPPAPALPAELGTIMLAGVLELHAAHTAHSESNASS